MSDVTDADRERAAELVNAHAEPYYDTGAMDCDTDALIPAIAAALAEERAKALADVERSLAADTEWAKGIVATADIADGIDHARRRVAEMRRAAEENR